eukprot:3835126-Pyramimonas_sp.AAC.1
MIYAQRSGIHALTGSNAYGPDAHLEDVHGRLATAHGQHGVAEAGASGSHSDGVVQPRLLEGGEGVRAQHLRPLVRVVPCRIPCRHTGYPERRLSYLSSKASRSSLNAVPLQMHDWSGTVSLHRFRLEATM